MATIDWTEQMEAVTKQWTDTQKQLWSSWGAAAQQAATTAQTKAVWQQMLDAWKNSVYRMLEMQEESARLWSESVASTESLEGMTQWAEQSYLMTKQWSNMQKQLWDGWFQYMERVDPAQLPSNMDLSSQPMKMWTDMVQQAGKMQQDWISTWTSWQPTKKG